MTWSTTGMIPTSCLTTTLLCTCMFAMHAAPARADTLTDALKECREISSDSARLACYDETTAKEIAPVVAKQTPDAPVAAPPVEKFGARGTAVARAQEQERIKEPEVESITAVVASISTRARGERVFVLDNGQTWVEKEAVRYFPVKVGDTVEIDSGVLGSFRLRHSSGRSTKVTRLE